MTMSRNYGVPPRAVDEEADHMETANRDFITVIFAIIAVFAAVAAVAAVVIAVVGAIF